MKFLTSLVSILALLGVVSGAEINWDAPRAITGSIDDFDTEGSPVYQWNGGSEVVTVDPTGLALEFSPGPNLGSFVSNIDPLNRGGDQSYEKLLGTFSWINSSRSLQLDNLIPGHRYRLQLWMADTRSCCSGRLKTYASGNGTQQVTLNSGPPSQYVIGSFIADSPTQEIQFIGSNAEHPQYNAIALRTLGLPTPDIDSFTCRAGRLESPVGINLQAAGQELEIRWQVSNATSLTLTQSGAAPIAISNSGSLFVNPISPGNIVLQATNEFGTTERQIGVFIDSPEQAPTINEVASNNENGLRDEDGEAQDWIELRNPNPFVIDVGNYQLTDDPTLAQLWQFPQGTSIPAEGYLVVFASGKNRTGQNLHTDFRLDADGDFLALLSPSDGVLDTLPADFPTTQQFPAIPNDHSYGYNAERLARFFERPSPGRDNGTGIIGFVGDTSFNIDRGYYDAAFDLVIQADRPSATIRYTTDGTEPTESNGFSYSGPITIDQTTVIRAFAFEPNYAPTNVDTHTYIFPADVIASEVMDTSITENPNYRQLMESSLKDLPIISLNIEDPEQLNNSTELRVSVEMLFPDGEEGFQEDSGITHFGGYFTNFAKKSFRLQFRRRYGAGKLRYPLFRGFESGAGQGILPVDEFDALDLRSGSHDMALRGAYLSNRFTDDTLLEMGNISPHGRFVHVFRNGVYWGQYHLRERWSADMAAEYFGGDEDDYEAINGNANVGGWSPGEPYDGDGSGWETIKELAAGPEPWANLQSRLDLQSYIDFWLLYDFGSSENEYRAFGQAKDNGVKMKFYLNDADGWTNPTGIAQNNDRGGPGNIMGELEAEADPDFKVYLADRIYQAYFNDGALSPSSNQARTGKWLDQTRLSFLCESARWGYRTPQSFVAYNENLIDNQFPTQTADRLAALRSDGRYPQTDAPIFNQNGGVVSSGFGLFMQSPDGGLIHYTMDGTDPRLPGGAVNPSAVTINGESYSQITIVDSRSEWRYLDDGSNQGIAWTQPDFNDAAWDTGNGKFGYGDNNETTTISFGNDSNAKHITSYFRKTFEIPDSALIDSLQLELLCDDGAVVYLNGVELIRSNLPAGAISFQTTASQAIGGSQESAFTQFELPANSLVSGSNLIAVEVHQAAPNSSDLGFDLRLAATPVQTTPTTPTLRLASNQTIKARAFNNGEWSALRHEHYIVATPPVVPAFGDLVVSEIHYHPKDPSSFELGQMPNIDEDDFEFIELMNVSSKTLLLDGCVVADGFDYVFPSESVLIPGQRLIVARNPAALELRHPGVQVNGAFASGKLSNSGEQIVINSPTGDLVMQFSYHDGSNDGNPDDLLWSDSPDGDGPSLVLIHPQSGRDLSSPLEWRASINDDGIPGGTDSWSLGTPLSDSDKDGWNELIERTLNSSDQNISERPKYQLIQISTDRGPDVMALRLTRDTRVPASLQVQTSTDLDNWNSDATLIERIQHSDGTETLTYGTPSLQVTDEVTRFFRIQVRQ